jgi:hypothetical protein
MIEKFRSEFDEALERGVPGATHAPAAAPEIVPPGAREEPMPVRAGTVA